MRLLCKKMPGAETPVSEKALAYRPASEDLYFQTVDDGRYTRRIYKSHNIREAEKLLNEQFKEFVREKNDQEMLSWAFDEHNFALRFTSSHQQNFQKSYDGLVQMQDWMRDGIADRLDY